MKNGLKIDSFGNKYWYVDSKRHRADGSALEFINGTKEWSLNDQFSLHRKDGLAVEYVNGNKYWYINGVVHREDGPAIEYADGDKSQEYADGKKYWFYQGKNIECSSHEEFLKLISLKAFW